MNSNLPVKSNNSFFGRIINFLKNLFYKPKEEKEEIKTKEEIIMPVEKQTIDKKNQFKESIKVEIKNEVEKDIQKEEFLDKIGDNPQLLYDLPIEKLEILEKEFSESLNKHEEKLAKLKKAS